MSTSTHHPRAVEQVFSMPELLEPILLCLLDRLHNLSDREDPRSVKTHHNARILQELHACRNVHPSWRAQIDASISLQRSLYIAPASYKDARSWTYDPSSSNNDSSPTLPSPLRTFYRPPTSTPAPILNPVVQTTFPSYHFRFWHLSLEASGNKYCAYLIVTRQDLNRYRAMISSSILTSSTKSPEWRAWVQSMLLSQPPCTALEAMIWEERDETRDYVCKTTTLSDPIIECEEGLRMGLLHDRVGAMFDKYPDVSAIKLTTV